MSNNIKYVVITFKDDVIMTKDVHEGVTKDEYVGNMFFLNKDSVLKCLCQMRITLGKMLPKGDLISEEDVQVPEEVVMKDNYNVLMGVVDLSDNVVEHVVHQMQLDMELSKI